jgi:hypothetical protein
MASSHKRLPNDVRSESVTTNVLVTWFTGYVTNDMAERRLAEFRELLARCTKPMWIMELTEMTGFDPRAVATGAAWWRAFKSTGGDEILFISAQSSARLAGAALSFSTGVVVRTFGTLDECLEQLGIIFPLHRPAQLHVRARK